MKKVFLWILGILLILLLVIGMTVYFLGKKNSEPTSNNTSGTTFPVVNSSNPTNSSSGATASVIAENGSTINTSDFLHNGVTIADPANAGTYYLAGSSGACKPDGSCPTAGTNPDFTIVYEPSDGSFVIGLATEPLGSVRLEAEQYLMQKLGITQQQMCELKYNIGTSTYVNQQYGGKNLGFSFCPGAVALPSN